MTLIHRHTFDFFDGQAKGDDVEIVRDEMQQHGREGDAGSTCPAVRRKPGGNAVHFEVLANLKIK